MHRHRKTPLWVSMLAVFASILGMLLLQGASEAVPTINDTQSSGVAVASTAATGSNCTPRPISAGEVTNQYVRTVDGSHEFTAYEAVEFGFSLALEEGHCEGDSIVFTVPSELGTDGSFRPVEMKAKDGTILAYARYSSDRTITVTLTDAVEDTSKHHFQASAWWKVHMESTLVPGEIRELEWHIGGEVRRTLITVGKCPNCSKLGAGPSKWGSVDSLKPWYLTVTIVTPTAEYDGQTFAVTDQSTSPGQDFDCPNPTVGQAGVYSSAGPWGQPQYSRWTDVTVVSCDSDKTTLTITLNRGEKARFDVLVYIDPADKGPWTDELLITSQEKTWTVSARITRKESGGGARFDPTPSPTPTPTPVTPSASPSPTPVTPSVSPTPTPTPAPTPEPSPTPTPAPTPTPTPVTPSVSPSQSPAPSATKSPSPSASLVPLPESSMQPRLAKTGFNNAIAALAVMLVALGVSTVAVAKVRKARSDG